MTRSLAAAGAGLLLLTAGCADGPKRHVVSGTVTLGGKPVPSGEIAFEPDPAKGNSGPGSVTRIKDGRYQTEPKFGVMGGAYIVRINPFDGVPNSASGDGNPLLPKPHVTTVEFPQGDATQHFDIPEPAKKPGG